MNKTGLNISQLLIYHFILPYAERGYYWIVSAWGPVSFNLRTNVTEKCVQLVNAIRGGLRGGVLGG